MDQGRAFGAPPARGGRAHAACRPNLAHPARRRTKIIPVPRAPASSSSWRPTVGSPVPLPLDCPATTARVKSAYGVPTGSASRLLTRAALTWFGSYQGDGADVASVQKPADRVICELLDGVRRADQGAEIK